MPTDDKGAPPTTAGAAGTAYEPPTTEQLRTGTIAAALIALAVLVTVVMPAEYGVDPLGTGRIFGISGLADDAPASTASERLTADGFRAESVTFTLEGGQGIEYKLQMDANETLLYEWATSDEEAVYFDFHGDTAANPDAFTSYAEGTEAADSGSQVVPFTGRHGWYWSNPGTEPVEISVRFAGHYETIGFV